MSCSLVALMEQEKERETKRVRKETQEAQGHEAT